MSEYQYYEFVAIDKPLTSTQMAELRSRSSRASITPTSFVNHYEWGNLKGDPVDWMGRYFDAHVYLANWCACLLLLRVPRDAIDARTLRAYASDSAFTVEKTNTHWILEWALQESENYDRFGMEDGEGWMGRLTSLRDELLRGDLRPLYLGWLAGVSAGEVDEDAIEPPRPPGLSRLTAAQQALAEFLEIGPDLLTAAGLLDQQASDSDTQDDVELDAWIAELPAAEQAATLKLLMTGHAQQAERRLNCASLPGSANSSRSESLYHHGVLSREFRRSPGPLPHRERNRKQRNTRRLKPSGKPSATSICARWPPISIGAGKLLMSEPNVASLPPTMRYNLRLLIWPMPIRFALPELTSTSNWQASWPGMENAVPWQSASRMPSSERNHSGQTIPILDLPLPDPQPKGAEWIDAYRRWDGT